MLNEQATQYLVVIEQRDGQEQRTVFVDADVCPLAGEAAAYVDAVLAPAWFVREVRPATVPE
ncbi:hypothetical protein DFR70_13312 [Nocardia tenerifensis]|uniref:Uncharacterized protein n=1 Tax=Nocardia tenerifensis TaxID=228006 RepID=A0A318K054_9NOCA|nr:hypothetical protein [Nocardia tenerifensis]PXX52280.1 hypothetical protein DFR70_13312 [Nocardia tenerifensis]